jgi:diguanylate cyclase (GGDEF)-like protein
LHLSIRQWAIWHLPMPVRLLVFGAASAYVTVIVAGLLTVRLSGEALLTTAAFAVAAMLSVEVSMRLAWPHASKDRISRDFLGVWTMPVALILPPPYVAMMVLAPLLYTQCRVWRRGPIKLIYSVASVGLSWAACSAVARAILGGDHLVYGERTLALTGACVPAILAAVAAWYTVNMSLIGGVVALTSGRAGVLAMLQDREGYLVDVVDLSVGIVAAILWVTSPLTVLLLVPPVLLMQHQLFSGLREAVRTDLLTDVANPQFWRETATREIERASASNANLAVLMVDIDHFKNVNDQYGHLAGDEVLAAVAHTISKALRPGDLVGRLGGEEFGAILHGLNLLDAEGAAERLRAQVSEIRVRSDRGEWISVTVSVGVAELSVTGGDLNRLLDSADTALYAAKSAGRNTVRVVGPNPGQIIDLRETGADHCLDGAAHKSASGSSASGDQEKG